MSKLRLLELFGGIGACSKALEKLGVDFEIVDYVEIDKYAVKSFNAIHNTNFEPQDITTWNKDIEVDLIMHGSPCQDFSLAGLQAGGDEGSGTRSSLMYETIRIVKKLRPKYVIWENVKNLLSKKHRHNFDSYLEIMEKLGYANYYQVLNAKDYGIPQNRERVFTVSILGNENYKFPKENIQECEVINPLQGISGKSWQFEQNVYSENSILRSLKAGGGSGNIPKVIENFEFPPKQELKLKLKDMLEDEVDEKYYLSEKGIVYALDLNDVQLGTKWEGSTSNGSINKDVAMTIGCRSASCQRAGITNYVVDNCNRELTVKEAKLLIKNNTKKGYLEATIGDGIDLAQPNSKTRRGRVQKEKSQTITTQNNLGVVFKNTKNYIEWKEQGKWDIDCRDYKEESISPTCTANSKSKVIDNLSIRKLTPKECWRLMGFDDKDFEKASEVNSNSQLYKQAGNSIVVNVLIAILNNLLKKENNNGIMD